MLKSHPNWQFVPHPLIRGGHLQSVLGIHWPRKAAPYQATQHKVALEDDEQLVLHEDAPLGNNKLATDESAPSVLLIHGLAGCHGSTYMVRMAERLTERGYRVFRMDMRSCGAGQKLAKRPPHCGHSADVAAALYYIAELYPDSITSVVGFSMGGTMTLNMLAEAGDMRVGNLERAMVVCPPLDLAHVEKHFRTLSGRLYNKFFVRLIWQQMLARWEQFPESAPAVIPKRPQRLYDIDEMVIAPSGGFASAQDYYEKTSPGPKLAAIKHPTTIVFSEDDPVVPVEPLFNLSHSSSVEMITTKYGGHLGFLGARNEDPDLRWLDWRIIDWLAESTFEKSTAEKSTAKEPAVTLATRADEIETSQPHTRATRQPQVTESTH